MDSEKDKYLALKLSDLNSMISFKEWLVDNLDIYKDPKKSPSDSEILIFLNFIKSKVFDVKILEKKEYLKKIKQIKKRIELKSK